MAITTVPGSAPMSQMQVDTAEPRKMRTPSAGV